MELSVVIPVSDDPLIRNCIESIDEDVEVVISLNKPSSKIKKIVQNILDEKKKGTAFKNLDIKTCCIDEPSIARGYNNGINNSSYEFVLLMDSDCTFKNGTIKKLWRNVQDNLLSKGQVVFQSNSFITGIIAKAREFHTSDKVNAYTPPLILKKEIKKYIGGYYFHDRLCWLEDSEFDFRVKKTNIKIAYDKSAIVYHPPLTPIRDLKSVFFYGVGKRIGVELKIHQKPTGLIGSFKKYVIIGSKEKGLLVGIYLFIWKITLFFGYYCQNFFRLRK